MQDTTRLETALRNAHNAGDTDAARRLAQEIQRVRASAPQQPESRDPRDMIPTDEPGTGGFVTREQADRDAQVLRDRAETRRERGQRVRSDAYSALSDPGQYLASGAANVWNNLTNQPLSELNPAQAFAEEMPAAQLGMQGATLGFGDEIMGGVTAAGAAVSGGNAGDTYRRNTDAAREELHANREAAPLTSLALEGAGGAMTGNVGSGFVRNASTRLGMAGRTAAVGAGYGAVAGTGEADGGVGQRAVGGAIGGTLGGVLGAGAPLTLEGGVRVGRAGLRLLGRAINSRGAGREITRNQRRALNQLISEAEAAGRPPAEVLRRIDELREAGASAEQTVAELLGEPGINRAAGGVLTGNADALQGRARVNQRQAQQPQRVRGYLREGIGATGSEFPTARAELDMPTPRETELYTAFRDQPPVRTRAAGRYERAGEMGRFSAALGDMRNDPTFLRLHNRARTSLSARQGDLPTEDLTTLRPNVLQRMYAILGDDIRDMRARPSPDTTAIGDMQALQRRLRDAIDDAYPGVHQAARAEGQLRLSASEALDEGRNIFRTENVRNPEEIAAMVERMTPEQLRRFRQGVARGVVDQMNTSPRNVIEAGGQVVESGSRDAANPISRFWNRTDRQEALRAAFGDEDTFLRFVRRMNIEGDRAADFRRMSPTTQGTATQRNVIATGLSEGTRVVADVGEAAAGNPIGPILRRITEFAAGNRTPAEVEREIQRILWASPEDIAPQLLSTLERRGVITASQAASLEDARRLAAPATNALIQSTQN